MATPYPTPMQAGHAAEPRCQPQVPACADQKPRGRKKRRQREKRQTETRRDDAEPQGAGAATPQGEFHDQGGMSENDITN
jgi:hypothetical protein